MQTEQLYGVDRRFGDALFAAPKGEGAMEVEPVVVNSGDPGREMWLEKREEEEENLLNGNEAASVFYADFPLPDFPCMSSSSSSSSTRAPVKATTCSSSSTSSASSSSSAASWAVLKSEDTATDKMGNRTNSRRSDDYDDNGKRILQHAGEAEAPPRALSSTASMEIILEPLPVDLASTDAVGSCIDEMDTFGYMDLLESNDFFDPASIFQSENLLEEDFGNQEPEAKLAEQQNQLAQATAAEVGSGNRTGTVSEELGAVLFEWLTENKDDISPDDLRRIKIKKATVENAAKRLGGGREAMKQLLKLILQWVKTNLQKKRLKESASVSASQVPYQYQEPFHHHQNPNPNLSFPPEPNSLHPQSFPLQPQWIGPPPPYVACPAPLMEVPPPPPGYGPAPGYIGDPVYSHGAPPDHLSGNPFPPEYQMINSAQSWPMSHYSMAAQPYDYPENFHAPPQTQGLRGYQHHQYPFQYYNGHGQRVIRLGSSATKEARKKRMARQRRFLSHHRSSQHHHQSNQQGNHQSMAVAVEQHARLGGENYAMSEAAHQAHNHPGSWVYWPSPANAGPVATPPPLLAVDPVQVARPTERPAMQPQNYQRQVAPERRQGWKPENNLKFLLQKVLKQSDVGNLGRIVLPKKEAETHLPELEARDGISIAMEDIGTSKVWNMRYRFWPNNKSRMYLLENTGDFVRANGLEEGDFIVIYSDVKCGKYLIRGVKVRQPEGSKLEAHKRPEKSQRNAHASSSQKKVLIFSEEGLLGLDRTALDSLCGRWGSDRDRSY